jgi:response regulator RpfG family c-di-GMP phosphodiesterase
LIKILLIEDKDCNLKVVENLLNPDKFSVHYSHDKNDGIEIAFRYLPDFILFHFEEKDDIHYLEQLFENEPTSGIPIIIIPSAPTFEEQRMLMEIGVEDYIPLWFLEESLLKTINCRYSKLVRMKERVNEQINSFEEIDAPQKNNDHLLVKIGKKLKLVKFSEIVCITALKEYSKIKTIDNFEILVRKSMRNWIKILPEKSFLRIHRATIINLEYIDKISQINNRTYTVSLKGLKNSFDFSYRYANIMRRTFPS